MTSDLYVWIYLPRKTEPVVAGRLSIGDDAGGIKGDFVYGKSYIANPEAIPLDPATLPLQGRIPPFTSLKGFPSALLDACPDRWGVKVINRAYGVREHPVGYLLLNDPGRMGALGFSTSATEPPKEIGSRSFDLGELLDAAERVERDQPVDPELLKALAPGTGGARPKCNITDTEAVWIAKFPSIDDSPLVSIPRLEHAIMTLATECGIDAAPTRLAVVDGKDVCLVKRFDREILEGKTCRRAALSARTVFYADAAYATLETGSYGRLSRWMPRYGGDNAQSRELFKRMVFNCLVRNTDDHELNHALVHVSAGSFKLAPAFDIVPNLNCPAIGRHALLIGDSGAGTIENIVSNAQAFRLTREEAIAITFQMQDDVLAKWQDACYGAGFGDDCIRRIEHVFRPLPERSPSPLIMRI